MRGRLELETINDGLIDPEYFPTLAGCFRGPVLRELQSRGKSIYLKAAFFESGVVKILGYEAVIEYGLRLAFSHLRRYYRSDYVYRTAIVSKLFLGRHSPESTTLLPELRVDTCKADIVMLNGVSSVYEIKTERDNTDRLGPQLAAYLKMFDRIYILTNEKHFSYIQNIAPEEVGILLLTPRFTIRKIRSAISNVCNVNPGVIFDTFRKGEWIEAIRMLYGSLPDARPLDLCDACRELFIQIQPEIAHSIMIKLLKRRYQLHRDDFANIPDYLTAAFIESAIPRKDWANLFRIIENTTLSNLSAS